MTSKSLKLLGLGMVIGGLALGGCLKKEPLLPQTAASIASGQTLIDEGKAMVSEGKALRSQGEDLMDKGEDLKSEGKAKINLGKQQIKATEILEEAESLRLKGHQLRQESTP